MNIDALDRELEATREQGLALLKTTAAKADADQREFTDEERAALKAITDQGLQIKARIGRARGDQSMIADLNGLVASAVAPTNGNGTGTGRAGRVLSLGDQFTSSTAYDFFKTGQHKVQSSWRSPSTELNPHWHLPRAATLTEDPASGGAVVIPQYMPGILLPLQRRLVVADLFASGTTSTNLIIYQREQTWTNAAAPVGEGLVKPESTLTFVAAQDPVRKIAHWLPVSEEMLEDVAQIRSYIDARLSQGVLFKEEDQLLHGTGIAPELAGLLTRAGLAADVPKGTMTIHDAVLTQIMAIFTNSFLMPDGIVMNPSDWSRALLTKTAQGNYLTPGPYSPIQTPTMWGLPMAITPATVVGTAVVGAFQTGAQIFRHGGLRVEASNSHSDFFIKNLVAIRAEERLALAVYRPQAFGKVTGLEV